MRKKVVFLPSNINKVLALQSLQFPIEVKKMTDEETKKYHLKKLLELAKPERELFFGVDGNVYDGDDNLVAEEPNYYQKQWVVFRLIHSNTWPKVHENKIRDVKNWMRGDGQ